MEAPASGIQGKNLGSPDEVRSFDKGRMNVVALDNVTVGKGHLRAGMAVVGGRQAYRRNRQLPGASCRVRDLGAERL